MEIFVILKPDGTPFYRDDAMGILATDSEAQAIRFQHAREEEGAEYVRYTRTQPPAGASVSERARECRACNGVGEVMQPVWTPDPQDGYDALGTCPVCGGNGSTFPEALQSLLYFTEHCLSAADEGVDYSTSREWLDAMTTMGVMKKTGRGKWTPSDQAQPVADALRALEQALTQPSDAQHERDLLAEAIGNAGIKCGLLRKDIEGLTGPQLLMVCDDMAEALTQQRGSEDGRSTLYSREALEIQGARWRALCRVIDHMSPGWDSGYIGAVEAAGAAVRALTTNGGTTPQPGAEALREWHIPNVIHDFKMLRFGIERVIHELRTYDPAADEYKGAHIHKVWADELESLLGRGGK